MGISTRAQAVLIATLGSEPQVVTAALDLLLAQGEAITSTWVLHTSSPLPAITQALEELRQAFAQPPYAGSLPLRLCPLVDESGRPLQDVETPEDARAAFRVIYRQVREAKLGGYQAHLLIAGGRKTLAVFGMAAAQMLFDEHDRLWHLYSAGDFLQSRRLHPQPGDQVHLIPIPLIRWSQVSPVLTDISRLEDPYQVVERLQELQLRQKIELARSFVFGSLTPAERLAVELLVREGLSDSDIAARLSLSPRTVEQHLRSAYQKAAYHWELADVQRAQLITLLNFYYSMENTGYPA